ncbi:MAG: hypothetical protein II370_04470, partial [Clostridia bacterium]|nr:hypothetical protein [Clostridia bacterium]
ARQGDSDPALGNGSTVKAYSSISEQSHNPTEYPSPHKTDTEQTDHVAFAHRPADIISAILLHQAKQPAAAIAAHNFSVARRGHFRTAIKHNTVWHGVKPVHNTFKSILHKNIPPLHYTQAEGY